jgi:hypothetical protein
MPIVGDITLAAVQRIDHHLDGGFVASSVPGLDGDPVQRSGRGSHSMRVQGILRGETAADDLAALQVAAAAGEEVPFAADITTALELQRVVVAELRTQQVAGFEQMFSYELHLVESPPLPPPAEVSGFGGLDDFGVGDLGFDTDIMDDLGALADEVSAAVDAVMEAADQLSALAALGSIDVGGPLAPLADSVAGVGGVASTIGDLASSIGGLLGGGG